MQSMLKRLQLTKYDGTVNPCGCKSNRDIKNISGFVSGMARQLNAAKNRMGLTTPTH